MKHTMHEVDHPRMAALAEPTAALPRFERRRKLGKSIYGEVFLASVRTGTRHRCWDSCCDVFPVHDELLVAVKISSMSRRQEVIDFHSGRSETWVYEDPLREARIMQHLAPHPNVLSYISDAMSGDQTCHSLVMEYAPHGDLFTVLDTSGSQVRPDPPSESFCRSMYRQLLEAVAHVHRHGVCHLDISCENILIAPGGQLKLCDFGIAQFMGETGWFENVRVRSKPGYMCPEIATGQPFQGAAADIFSLGTVFYMIATRYRPFDTALPSNKEYALIGTGRLNEYLFRAKIAHQMTPDWLSLLSGMMAMPESRLTLEQVRAHPFFAERP